MQFLHLHQAMVSITISICYLSIHTIESHLYVNEIGVIPNDYLLSDADIVRDGVLCIGGKGLTSISWILPNGVILESDGIITYSNIQLERITQFIAKLSLSNNETISSQGIYRCRTEFDNGAVQYSRVWIVDETSEL